MRVVLLGSGGREHAIGWSLVRSERLDALISIPGNPGIAELGPVDDTVSITDPQEVVDAARHHEADLVVVGPEAPLAAGVADALRAADIPVFGPNAAAAQLEASKRFANDVMARAGVPTGASWAFSDARSVVAHLDSDPGPYVVKADGLAGGKGVLVTAERDEAETWAVELLDGRFGEAGSTVVVEEYLDGREVSVFAICDGETALPLAPARDYKRQLDGDEGPNTGGMGCFSPVEDLPADLVPWTMANVIEPVLRTLADDGNPFNGFLYAGLMLTAAGPKVLEFNVRLGDPETQVVLPRLESDLLDLLDAAANGRLESVDLDWSQDAAVNVVLASEGYPEAPVTGRVVSGVDGLAGRKDVLVFQAGTETTGDGLIASGGRVLNIVGRGADVERARSVAYAAAAAVHFDGMQFRSDIAAPA